MKKGIKTPLLTLLFVSLNCFAIQLSAEELSPAVEFQYRKLGSMLSIRSLVNSPGFHCGSDNREEMKQKLFRGVAIATSSSFYDIERTVITNGIYSKEKRSILKFEGSEETQKYAVYLEMPFTRTKQLTSEVKLLAADFEILKERKKIYCLNPNP